MASKEQQLAIKIKGKCDKSLDSAINQTNSKIQNAGKILGNVAKVGAAAVAAIATASIKVGTEFESSMSSLAATAGLDTATAQGQADYEKLEAAARDMGKATTKTASEAADALNYMALAGWDVDTSVTALEPVLRLSEAADLDLATTSDLVTDSMSAMGVSIDELSGYLDVCAAASTSSNQTTEDLMEAMIRCGGAAKNAGLDYEDTATALGILANNGVKGEKAGTALNSMLVRMATNSTAQSAFEDLGIAIYDDTGTMRNLQDILVDTGDAMAGMTDEEKQAAAASIAGKNYYSDFLYLLEGATETVDENGTAWDNLTASLDDSQGALEQMAETKTDNLEGDLSRLTSITSDLGICIYDELCEPLRGVTQIATDAMTSLDDAFGSGGMSAMLSQVGPVVMDMASQLLSGLGSMLPDIINCGVDFIMGLVEGFASGFPQLLSSGFDVVNGLVQGIVSSLPTIIQSGTQALVSFVQGITSNLGGIASSAIDIVLSLVNGLIGAIPYLIAAVPQLIGALVDAILNTDWISLGVEIITSIGQGILDAVGNLGSTIMSAITGLFSGGDADTSASTSGTEVAESYAAGIEENTAAVSAATDSLTASAFTEVDTAAAMEAGTEQATAYTEGLDTALSAETVAETMTGTMTEAGTEGGTAFTDALSASVSDTSVDVQVDVTESMQAAGVEGANALVAGIESGGASATAAAQSLMQSIADALTSGWNTVTSQAQSAMTTMTSTLTNGANSAASSVKSAFSNMSITIPKPKVPVISVSYSTESYGDGGSVKIPKFSVGWNAAGGIFDTPTLFNTAQGVQGVGEAGPEAVTPLDEMWEQIRSIMTEVLQENNGTSAFDSLLQKLEGVNVEGGTAGQTYEAAGGQTITYAPVYNLNGTATKQDAVEAEKISQAEFARMMQQYEKQKARTAF